MQYCINPNKCILAFFNRFVNESHNEIVQYLRNNKKVSKTEQIFVNYRVTKTKAKNVPCNTLRKLCKFRVGPTLQQLEYCVLVGACSVRAETRM
jgi:hypothetical protein